MRPCSPSSLALCLLLMTLLAVGGVTLAQDQGGDDADKPPKKPLSPFVKATSKPEARTKVWTNEDLARLASGGAEPTESSPAAKPVPPVAPAAQEPAVDPLAALQQQSKRRAERQNEIAEAQRALVAAEARVAALEKQSLAVRNPFLARPKVAEAEREAWKGMSPTERAAHTEEALTEARAEVERARAALDSARRAPL